MSVMKAHRNELEKLHGSEREEEDDMDNFDVSNVGINVVRTMQPLSMETSPQRSDHSPQNHVHQQRVKRSTTKQRIIAGFSFLICCACISIYYDSEITHHPLLQKKEKRKRSNGNVDPALLVIYPELFTSPHNNIDTIRSIEEVEIKNNAEERQITGGAFSSLFTAIGYINADTRWDFDGPPVGLTDGANVRPPPNERNRMITSTESAGKDSSVDGSDSVVLPNLNESVSPVLTGYSDLLFTNNQLHADAALKCSESVKNFVINATDGKDECDGLIKAYEKTCSDNAHEEESTIHSRRHLYEHARKRRRKLWNKLNTPIILRWKAYVHQTVNTAKRLRRKLLLAIGFLDYDVNSIFIFAEDEVLKAWDDAQHLVDNNIHDIVQNSARRLMNEGRCIADATMEGRRRLQPDVDENNVALTVEKHETITTGTTSLHLPIKSQDRLSDKSANDALLLQENGIILKAVDESTSETHDEAAKSKKAVSDTGNAVSALLNDPSSKEAITCCSSILSVYHDLCSTDVEEQVSDARLFFFIFVLACCGMVKSLIRHYKLLWLPEAAGCILVGGTYLFVSAPKKCVHTWLCLAISNVYSSNPIRSYKRLRIGTFPTS